MRRVSNTYRSTLLTMVGLLGLAASAHAQLNSSTATVSLTATLAELLTVTATPAAVTFNLVSAGTATASAPIAVTTTWVVGAARATVVVDAYFASTSAALTTAGPPAVNIPTSAVLGQVLTGMPTTYTAFTQSPALGTAGAGLQLVSQALTVANRAASRTDNLNLEINLSALPQIPAAVYTGTLVIAAQAL